MAKRILKLSTFHGGLNNNSDERDLDDNQVSDVVGLELSNIGKLQPNYHPKKDQSLSDSVNSMVVNDSIVPGSKFFSFVADKPLIHINQLYFFGTITSSLVDTANYKTFLVGYSGSGSTDTLNRYTNWHLENVPANANNPFLGSTFIRRDNGSNANINGEKGVVVGSTFFEGEGFLINTEKIEGFSLPQTNVGDRILIIPPNKYSENLAIYSDFAHEDNETFNKPFLSLYSGNEEKWSTYTGWDNSENMPNPNYRDRCVIPSKENYNNSYDKYPGMVDLDYFYANNELRWCDTNFLNRSDFSSSPGFADGRQAHDGSNWGQLRTGYSNHYLGFVKLKCAHNEFLTDGTINKSLQLPAIEVNQWVQTDCILEPPRKLSSESDLQPGIHLSWTKPSNFGDQSHDFTGDVFYSSYPKMPGQIYVYPTFYQSTNSLIPHGTAAYFYVSYIWDGGESALTYIGYNAFGGADNGPGSLNVDVAFNVQGWMPDKRIKGVKIYAEFEEGVNHDERVNPSTSIPFIGEVHFEKGARSDGDSGYSKMIIGNLPTTLSSGNYGDGGSVKTRAWVRSISSFNKDSLNDFVETYDSLNFHDLDDVDKTKNDIRWKCSTVVNNRVYVGNILKNNVSYGDMILRSDFGMYDIFPWQSRIEVQKGDGDQIIALNSIGEYLMQFKRKTVSILNVSQDPYLELIFENGGVEHKSAQISTKDGVFWANKSGVFLYNGQQISDVTTKNGEKLISAQDWDSFYTKNVNVTYDKHRSKLIIFDTFVFESGSATIKSYIFDISTQSWTYDNQYGSDYNGSEDYRRWSSPFYHKDILYLSKDFSEMFEFDYIPDKSYTGASDTDIITKYCKLTTKDYDFNNPGQRKKVYKIYITYSGIDVDGLNLSYHTNAGNTDLLFAGSSSPLTNTGFGEYNTIELKPSTSSQANNIYSIALSISGNTKSDFKLKDISIVYREKAVK